MSKIILVSLLWCSTVQAQGYTASRAVLYGTLAADLLSTQYALNRGYREANPILGQNTVRRVAIAVGGTVALDVLFKHYVRPSHPRAVVIFNFTVGAVHVGAAVWNWRAK